ncbi:hypothetical protein SGUI_0924 [Serinicoccus hydrothermalis]|uniref:Uncharacterized protein n=1 Tax=Serinicoccus hydrothermalis TaxID=1758689 RepID=A0A1B1NA47_9MICO|nr:hypothetical protein [Serinicoccus hydrothermalis]ANS78320.1 hypothetical protein SGUI_0924 [Serinicoccus hydrothermalis]
MSAGYAQAPAAPGSLGGDVPDTELLAYLDAMLRWKDQRRSELAALDQASLEVAEPAERAALTPDVTLSMTLWQAVADRLALIQATWDSGRVGEQERRRITTLVWGTLEQPGTRGAQSLAVSLPEACRLSDSLASSLRSRLRLDGADPDLTGRLRSLRQQVERIADQVALIPDSRRSSAEVAHGELDQRLSDVTDRAARGADVGGLLAPLESRAATVERDLIVAASARAHAKADHAQATREVAELTARGQAVLSLAHRARATVSPAPRLGVPDVSALGEVPTAPAELTAYRERLGRVERALGVAHSEYAAALDRLEDLTERATTVREALADEPAVLALAEQTDTLLRTRPTDLTRLEALVQAQESFARTMGVTP